MLPYDAKVSAASITPPLYFSPSTVVPVTMGDCVCWRESTMDEAAPLATGPPPLRTRSARTPAEKPPPSPAEDAAANAGAAAKLVIAASR